MFYFRDSLIHAALRFEVMIVEMAGVGLIRVQFNAAFEFFFSLRPIPGIEELIGAPRDMCLRQLIVKFERLGGISLCLGIVFLRRGEAKIAKLNVGIS